MHLFLFGDYYEDSTFVKRSIQDNRIKVWCITCLENSDVVYNSNNLFITLVISGKQKNKKKKRGMHTLGAHNDYFFIQLNILNNKHISS